MNCRNEILDSNGIQYRFASSTRTYNIANKTVLIRQNPFRWVDISHVPCKAVKLLFKGAALSELLGVVSSHFDSATLIRFLHKLQRMDFFSESISKLVVRNNPLLFFQITGRCNLTCDYCYNSLSIRNSELSYEDIVRAYRIVEKSVDLTQGAHIHFHGGEPLCNWETLRRSILFFRNNTPVRCKISFTTNATLLTREIVDFVRDNDVEIRISVDGIPEIHDKYRHFANGTKTYEDVIANYLLFGDYKKIVFLTTVTNDNASSIGEIVNSYIGLKVPSVMFRPFYQMGCALDKDNIGISYKLYFNLIKYLIDNVPLFNKSNIVIRNLVFLLLPFLTKASVLEFQGCKRCAAYSNSFFISSNGYISGCDMLPNNDSYHVGYLNSGGLDLGTCNELSCELNEQDTSCESCCWKSICGGGCAALAKLSFSKKNIFTCNLNHLVFPYLIEKVIDDYSTYRAYFDKCEITL